jgi:hypothetical protein
MADKLNPIPFNPDTLTISQAKQCVEALSQLYDALDRGLHETDPNNVLFHMEQGRDALRKQWAK